MFFVVSSSSAGGGGATSGTSLGALVWAVVSGRPRVSSAAWIMDRLSAKLQSATMPMGEREVTTWKYWK